ncbi:MAG: FHA domain-containing protein [Propionibacteriaceae bacterium]|jgi:hypothetical protein|nr:FHA domain-containing protein [Propionibacteriaceae bacterium]
MRYNLGSWWGVVTATGCIILPPDTPADKVEALWERADGGFAEVVGAILAAYSFAGLPDFAIAVVEDQGVHVAVRGHLVIEGTGADGAVHITGAGVMTWREELVGQLTSLRIVAEDGGPAFPIMAGVVRLAALTVVGEDVAPGAAAPDQPAVATPTAADTLPFAPPLVVRAWPPDPAPPTRPAEVPTTGPAAPVAPVVDAPGVPDVPGLPEPAAEPAPATPDVPVPGPPAPPPPPELTPEPDRLVPPPPPEPAGPPEPTGQTTLMTGDYPFEGESAGADDLDVHSTTFYRDYFLDGAEPGAAPVPPAAPPPPPPADLDDHDGHTVLSLADLDDPEDHDGMTMLSVPAAEHDGYTITGVAPPPPPPTGPLVLARMCTTCGTANPTKRVACRACGVPLTGDAMQIPRPALGRVRLPDGRVVPLTGPLIIGRRPEVARFSNQDIPTVITVDDPHVSSTHLKIDLEDWSVLVTSLGRNGTILCRVGQPDRRFTDAEQTIAQAGDVYRLSNELSVAIEELA